MEPHQQIQLFANTDDLPKLSKILKSIELPAWKLIVNVPHSEYEKFADALNDTAFNDWEEVH